MAVTPAGPPEWALEKSEGAGPFTTRLSWFLPDGSRARWSSRVARKRGTVELAGSSGEPATAVADPALLRRLGRLNWVAAVSFVIGGSLFALGAAISQLDTPNAATSASIYLTGGVFFSTGAYASLLQAINAPEAVTADATLAAGRWRWWSYEPLRLEWLATFVLFAGTLVFAINLIDSFIQGLSNQQENRLIWAPDMVGCILFLISGHLSMVEVCHGRPRLLPRDLSWWITAVNQLGSVLFFISGLAAFIRPATSSAVNVDVANWGTFAGAACFVIGGILQTFERPAKA